MKKIDDFWTKPRILVNKIHSGRILVTCHVEEEIGPNNRSSWDLRWSQSTLYIAKIRIKNVQNGDFWATGTIFAY